MIRLIAHRKDIYGHFEFRIEAADAEPVVTCEALKAAKILFNMGVESPLQLVEHARTWGSVEIINHSGTETAT